MKVENVAPPNFELIRAALPVPPHACFTFGETIYNPSARELPPDILLHESVHSRQQGNDPHSWWNRYLTDPEFRYAQELEAYGEQFVFTKKHIEQAAANTPEGHKLAAGKNNLIRHALNSMAAAFCSEAYGFVLSLGEAESKIRTYAKSHP